jgi:uncharacterized protein
VGASPRMLRLLDDTFAVCRLEANDPIPTWATAGRVFSLTRTPDELSVVCPERAVPDAVRSEGGWRCLQVVGRIAFAELGVLAGLASPLAQAGVSVFALSTFDTDYLLIKEELLEKALAALRGAGHTIS